MKEELTSLKKILQPYLFISVAGLLAFAPVSFMLRALKNDIIALEYPINHFISQSIHNGDIPYWFNTWGMGFPLQSNLTWGIFSTPQLLFSTLFDYNIYILHIEFMFFVLLAGWGMYYLLQKHIVKDKPISQLLSICYMLSGFMVGSTQWLLYITAAAFIPLLIASLLSLLRNPSIKHSIQFAVVYLLMFTSVYAAFNIITSYSLLIFIAVWLLFFEKEKKSKAAAIKYLSIAGLLTFILCLPSMYFTSELLNRIGRGSSITTDSGFFNSNYLHPAALSNLLLPFSSVKMSFSNTEGTMLNSYVGLFVLITIPFAVWNTFKEKNRPALSLLFSALFFILISFGEMTPLRNALNMLPGFSYFRNPAIFRLYFIISIILYIGVVLRNNTFAELFYQKRIEKKFVVSTVLLLLTICLAVTLWNSKEIKNISLSNISAFIKNINYNQTLLINAIIQIGILGLLLLIIRLKWRSLFLPLLTLDLIINTLICTPFFSVSSYRIPEVNTILAPAKGFPIQIKSPAEVAATYVDSKNNTWYNVNIFKKEISTRDSYRGPLTLSNFYSDSTEIEDNNRKSSIMFIDDSLNKSLQLLIQHSTHIKASINLEDSSTLTLLQNYYPGWRAYYNNKEVEIIRDNLRGMSIPIPKGKGTVEFIYERKTLWLSALALHLLVIFFLIWKLVTAIRKHTTKSASLS